MALIPMVRPTWYTDEDDTAWEKVKAAFHRDCQLTRRDLGGNDPLRASSSNIQIPDPTAATSSEFDKSDEPAHRYGYAASRQYGSRGDWDDQIEALLRTDWEDEKEWERRREAIKRGFAYGRLQRRLTSR